MDLLSGDPSQSAIGTQIGKSPTLVEEVTARITSDITRGLLPLGGRLPTEKDMMLSMGVSRTVIREAIAQLRSRGLVFTQQGRGAFVAEDARAGPLHIVIAGKDATRDTLHLMDLRIALEVEGAALAAANALREDLASIQAAEQRVAETIKSEGFGIAEDYAFHRQIALATGNPHFPCILDFLSQFMIPRTRRHFSEDARVVAENQILDDHRQVVRFIVEGDAAGARHAMRQHLERTRKRYAAVAAGKGQDR
jgi:DNA-binding FadR family transcriptional regulator